MFERIRLGVRELGQCIYADMATYVYEGVFYKFKFH